MFWPLNGATRQPRRASKRQIAGKCGTENQFEPIFSGCTANLLSRKIVEIKAGNFDAVKAMGLDFRKEREVLSFESCCPDEGIDTELHTTGYHP